MTVMRRFMQEQEMNGMEEDLIIFEDEDGNEYSYEVVDYMFYNGEEYALLADAARWDEQLRTFAADQLLDAVNDLLEDETVDAAALAQSLTPESIQTAPEGAVTIWYGSDLFFGRAVKATGTPDAGLTEVLLED